MEPAAAAGAFSQLRALHPAAFGPSGEKGGKRKAAQQAMMRALCDPATGLHWGVASRATPQPLQAGADLSELRWRPVSPRAAPAG
jgi:hypothetical protein